MKVFFSILLLGAIGACGYFYWDLRNSHEENLNAEQKKQELILTGLNEKKSKLEEQIADFSNIAAQESANNLQDLFKEFQDPESDATLKKEEKEDASEASSVALALKEELKKKVRTRQDLEKHKDKLQQLLAKDQERITNLERQVELQIEKNTRNMEAKRAQVYRNFEARYARSKESKITLGPRYAKEKKKLDEQADAYRERVSAQNQQMRGKVAANKVKAERQQEIIEKHLDKVEDLLLSNNADFHADMDVLRELENETNASPVAVKEPEEEPRAPEQSIDSDKKLLALKNELAELNHQIMLAPVKQEKALEKVQQEHDNIIQKIYLGGGAAAALLLLIMFSSFFSSRNY